MKVVLCSESVQSAVESHVKRLAGMRVAVVADPLFPSISGTEASQGVIALVEPPIWNLPQLVPRAQPGGGAGRLAGPRKRRHHRARGRSLRRHRHHVSEGHGQPIQSRKPCAPPPDRCSACPSLMAWIRRWRAPRCSRTSSIFTRACRRNSRAAFEAARRSGFLPPLRAGGGQRSARREPANCAPPPSIFPSPPRAWNP